VFLEGLELGRADLSRPFFAQLIEDRFTLPQNREAELRDLEALAAGVEGICVACHVSALLQDRDRFFAAACFETDRQRPSSEAVSTPATMALIAKSRTGRTSS
jgi:hypothetical protein